MYHFVSFTRLFLGLFGLGWCSFFLSYCILCCFRHYFAPCFRCTGMCSLGFARLPKLFYILPIRYSTVSASPSSLHSRYLSGLTHPFGGYRQYITVSLSIAIIFDFVAYVHTRILYKPHYNHKCVFFISTPYVFVISPIR